MPRQARLDSPGALRHVMIRGTRGVILLMTNSTTGTGGRREWCVIRTSRLLIRPSV